MNKKYFSEYYKIRDTIDLKISEILSFYKTDIMCKKGCSGCCTAITLFPVEFFALEHEIAKKHLCHYPVSCAATPSPAKGISDTSHQHHQSQSKQGLCHYPVSCAATPSPTKGISETSKQNQDCIFLENSICKIYDSRPIICRTQGLPLLYFSDKLENYTITFCEKNFTSCDEDFEFNTEYSIDLDKLNSSLYKLNKEFVEDLFPKNKMSERIPISLLLSAL